MDEVTLACYHSSLYALVIASVTISGFMDPASTEDGLEHYAEKPWDFLHPICPWLEHIPMPLNTVVNLFYVAAGIYWILKLKQSAKFYPSVFKEGDLYMSYMFAWMSILYGNVQLIRILTQHHRAAILDQWYTLPIFTWGACAMHHVQYGWNLARNLKYIRVSTMSYGLALLHPLGFDVALGVHIVFVLSTIVRYLWMLDTIPRGAKSAFWKTFFSCVGFVVLKVLDHHLPHIHPVFSYVSGHFLSKICDALQFYYGIEFFFHVFMNRGKFVKTKKIE